MAKTMTRLEQLAELDEVLSRTFNLANSFAGGDTGYLAGTLHQSANLMMKVSRQLDGTDEPRTMLDMIEVDPQTRMNTMLADLLS